MQVFALVAFQLKVAVWPMETVLGFGTSDTCGAVGVIGPEIIVSAEDDSPQAARAEKTAQAKAMRDASATRYTAFDLISDLVPAIRRTKLIARLPHDLPRPQALDIICERLVIISVGAYSFAFSPLPTCRGFAAEFTVRDEI